MKTIECSFTFINFYNICTFVVSGMVLRVLHVLFKPETNPLKCVYALILANLQLTSRQHYGVGVYVHQNYCVAVLAQTCY